VPRYLKPMIFPHTTSHDAFRFDTRKKLYRQSDHNRMRSVTLPYCHPKLQGLAKDSLASICRSHHHASRTICRADIGHRLFRVLRCCTRSSSSAQSWFMPIWLFHQRELLCAEQKCTFCRRKDRKLSQRVLDQRCLLLGGFELEICSAKVGKLSKRFFYQRELLLKFQIIVGAAQWSPASGQQMTNMWQGLSLHCGIGKYRTHHPKTYQDGVCVWLQEADRGLG
jgi:hypothetical protein